MNLKEELKKQFRNYTTKQLLDRANMVPNDDDELFEMVRRKKAGEMNFKAGWDKYILIE